MKLNPFRFLLVLLLFIFGGRGYAQIQLHTKDLPHIYQAFDSVMTTADTARQLAFI